MKRLFSTGLAGILTLAIAACGGGDAEAGDDMAETPAPAPAPATAPAAAPSGSVSAVDWVTVDDAAQTVTIDLVAGSSTANNRWNYNGYANGEVTVVVPEGYAVTINFSNEDPANMHSVAVLDAADTYPVMFDSFDAAFDGAASSNPTSMTEATATGASETVTFTAGSAGDYALVCLIPAHAQTGMWIGFEVSADGMSGARM